MAKLDSIKEVENIKSDDDDGSNEKDEKEEDGEKLVPIEEIPFTAIKLESPYGNDQTTLFATKEERLMFIRKVYALLTLQLAITSSIAILYVFTIASWLKENKWFLWISL